MKSKSKFRRWGWAYDLDEQAPSALFFDDTIVLKFEPMNPEQRAKLTKFITLLNNRKFIPSPNPIAKRKATSP